MGRHQPWALLPQGSHQPPRGSSSSGGQHSYVFAHAYTPASIERCSRLGVRSIEHGNQLDESSATTMARHGTFLSQTIITYAALKDSGAANGMPQSLLDKVGSLVEEGVGAVRIAQRHGVRVTYGSDLLGSARTRQLEGFGYLLDAGLSPLEALATATSAAADLVGLAAGAIEAGRLADLVLLRCDPLDPHRLRALAPTDVEAVWVGARKVV